MSEMNEKLNSEQLDQVTGGNDGMGEVSVIDIYPMWVIVTASELNCRYTPNGKVAKVFKRGRELKVDGITMDGKWYRLWIYYPKGGECYGYIFKDYTVKK